MNQERYGVYVWSKEPVDIINGSVKFTPDFVACYFDTEQDAREFALLEQLAGKTAKLFNDIPLVKRD